MLKIEISVIRINFRVFLTKNFHQKFDIFISEGFEGTHSLGETLTTDVVPSSSKKMMYSHKNVWMKTQYGVKIFGTFLPVIFSIWGSFLEVKNLKSLRCPHTVTFIPGRTKDVLCDKFQSSKFEVQ